MTEYDISKFCAGTAQDYKAMQGKEKRQKKKYTATCEFRAGKQRIPLSNEVL